MGLFRNATIIRTVGGKDVTFFELSYLSLLSCAPILPQLGELFTVLFPKSENDVEKNETSSGTAGGDFQRALTVKAIDPKLAEFRETKRTNAIKHFISLVAGPAGENCLKTMLTKTLRNEVIGPNVLEEISPSELVEFFAGLVEVNGETFRPLVQRAGLLLSAALKVKSDGMTQPADGETSSTALKSVS